MKKFMKLLFYVFALAIYLNIGWELGGYTYDHIYTNTDASKMEPLAYIISGPNQFVISNNEGYRYNEDPSGREITQYIASGLWIVIIAMDVITWMFYGLYHIIVFLAALIFAGGITELGIEWFAVIGWITIGLAVIFVLHKADEIAEAKGHNVKNFDTATRQNWFDQNEKKNLILYLLLIAISPISFFVGIAGLREIRKMHSK